MGPTSKGFFKEMFLVEVSIKVSRGMFFSSCLGFRSCFRFHVLVFNLMTHGPMVTIPMGSLLHSEY